MNETELEQRRAITANERLIISLNEEGNFRVYSPAYPTKSYTVSGTPEGPKCTCADFEGHKDDPDWKCNHMLAVLNLLSRSTEPAATMAPYGSTIADVPQNVTPSSVPTRFARMR